MGKRPGTTGPMPRKLRPNASPHAEKHRTSGKISSKTVNFAANANDHEYRSKPKDRVGRRNRRSTLGHTARRAEDRRRPRELRLPHVAVRAAQLRGQRRRRRRGGTRTPQPAPRKRVGHMLETVPFPTGTVEVTLDGAGIPSYEIRQGVAWDNIPFTPQIEELARHTRAACFGSLAQRSPYRTARSGVSWKRCPTARDNTRSSTSTCGSTSTRSRWSKSRCESATS